MVAESENTVETQIRVFKCTDCSGYLIAVGSMGRSVGSIVPVSCLFVNKALRGCDGSYKIISAANARGFVANLSKAVSGNVTDVPSEQQLKGGEKR